MSEHHTQGRRGQGARHRRHYNRNYRHRMPRQEELKPSFFRRVMSFFGFGKKKEVLRKEKKSEAGEPQLLQKVRVAQSTPPRRGNSAAVTKKRHRAVSVSPTEHARLYVGNLSFDTTEAELEDLFKGFGRVHSVEIIYNSRTYRSKGYAFVEMEQLPDACRAAEQLHGQPFMGRELRVSAANARTEGDRSTEQTLTANGEHRRGRDESSATDTPQREPITAEEATFDKEVVVNLTSAESSN